MSVSAPIPASPLSSIFNRDIHLKHPKLKRPYFNDGAQDPPAKRLRALGSNSKYLNPATFVPKNQRPLSSRVNIRQSIALDLQFVPATEATFKDEARRQLPVSSSLTPPAPVKPVLPAPDFTEKSKHQGLVNDGGVKCYRNSVFQVILHSPEIVGWFENQHKPETCVVPSCVACQIRQLIKRYWRDNSSKYRGVDEAIRATHRLMERLGWRPTETYAQHDAHEYLLWVFQTMTAQLSETEANSFADNISIHFKRSVICNHCKDASDTFVNESFFTLSLFPRARDLRGFMDNALSQKIDDRKCPECKRLGARQVTTILRAPAVLPIQLCRTAARFSRGHLVQFKDKHRVSYPSSLDLTVHKDAANSQQRLSYDLVSVVVHSGAATTSGHYFSAVKLGSDWHTFNDKLVKRSSVGDALDPRSGESYLLFYRLR